MKILLKIMFLVLFLLGSVSSNQNIKASWAFQFVQWHENTYKITNEKVTSVGREIGSVTKYADIEGSYSGDFSNAVPVGTKYYEIPGIDTSKAIAIEKNGEFVKAEFIGHIATNASTRHTPNTQLYWSNALNMQFNWGYIIILPIILVILLVSVMWFSSKNKR